MHVDVQIQCPEVVIEAAKFQAAEAAAEGTSTKSRDAACTHKPVACLETVDVEPELYAAFLPDAATDFLCNMGAGLAYHSEVSPA